VGNDRAGADDGTFSNTNSGKKNGAGTDVGPFLDVNRFDFEVGFDDGAIVWDAGVG
jgi:hypothetical protein